MVCTVSKPGDLVSPDDAQDITLEVEQWQHLAGADQVFDISTCASSYTSGYDHVKLG